MSREAIPQGGGGVITESPGDDIYYRWSKAKQLATAARPTGMDSYGLLRSTGRCNAAVHVASN
jgi:hypothetical protein